MNKGASVNNTLVLEDVYGKENLVESTKENLSSSVVASIAGVGGIGQQNILKDSTASVCCL